MLAVSRTVTSTVRVLDAVAVFSGDHRVQVVFTVNESSAFVDGVNRLLGQAGARVVPWRQARRLPFNAVVTASENTELDGLDGPVLVLPHGVGFHKRLPDPRGPGHRLSGTVRARDMAGGRVLVAVSHPSQAEQLRAHDPLAAGRTVVVADPVYERLRAAELFRDRYRRALGTADRKLIVVSSTWGRQSLLGRWPDLPARLLGELPADEYQVLAILHPNIWSAHGAWQVRSWLARANDAGLLTVPPEDGWQAALVAADAVVGDHGSVSLYAAAIDRPLVLAPFGDEVVRGTSLSLLGHLATRLSPGHSLADQVAGALASHTPGRYREAAARSFADRPEARPLREVLYGLISLAEPVPALPLRGWPEPRAEGGPATSYAVYTHPVSPGAVRVRRIPAAVDLRAPHDGWLRHLAVYEQEWDLRMVHSASAVIRQELGGGRNGDPDGTEEGLAWARDMLGRLPGAQVTAAATSAGCLVVLRDGRSFEVTTPGSGADAMLLAACVYTRHCLPPDGAPIAGPLRLDAGGKAVPVHIRQIAHG